MIRSFDWRDFPNLHRNRNDGVWLDTVLALTRWNALVPAGALLATLAPATGIFTYVASRESEDGASPVIGQIIHPPGSIKARLTFITPAEAIESSGVIHLLDHLAKVSGERGAHNLLAEVDELSPVYEVLRRNGFAIYTRQRVWELEPRDGSENRLWQQVAEEDEDQVHYLYHSLVPALVQQTEPPPWEKMNGLAFVDRKHELQAYVQLSYGPTGILAQPFVHPGTDHAEELLETLYNAIPHARSRPVYIGVRSHQAWLAPFLDRLGFESGPRQAVMVKRLVVPLKERVPARVKNAGLENIQPKTTTFNGTSIETDGGETAS